MGTTGIVEFDRFYDDLATLTTGGQVIPAWSLDGKHLVYVDGPADERQAKQVDLATGETSDLFDVPALRSAIQQATGETPPGRGVPFPALAFVGLRMVATQIGATTLLIDLDTLTVIPQAINYLDEFLGVGDRTRPQRFPRTTPLIDPVPSFEVMSPDGRHFLSTRDHNIVVRATADGRERALTTDGTPEVEWCFDLADPALAAVGLASPVTNWSPDGSRIAVYRVDNRGVAQVPQVHYLKHDDEVVWRYYAKAGGVLERATLHVLDVFGGAAVAIDLGDTTDTYPVHAGWLPDGDLLVFQLSRDCRTAEVSRVDLASGTVTKLFTEQGETFVRIHHDIYYARQLGLWLTPDGQHIVWSSERDGVKHLYLYDTNGTLVRQLTSGDTPVDNVCRIDADFVDFTAHSDPDRPYDTHVCRVPLGGGATQVLTESTGVHTAMFSPDGATFIDTWSRPDQPTRSVLRRCDGTQLAELSTADRSALDDLGWTPPREFTVTAADGETALWGTMFFPCDFDEAKQYPLIELIYAGPQMAVAPHMFLSPFTRQAQAVAQLGYVTVVIDSRGTPERSKAFHDAAYRNFGGFVDDHASGIRQLLDREPFLVSDKAGITGGSWGAYAAFRCLAERPDVYRAAVANAPGFDPYSCVLYECYLGFPQTDRAAYEAAQTLTLAGRIEGDLMIACGTSDHATWTDAVKMADALIRAGKSHEFVVLPEQIHGYESVHDGYYYRKLRDFFATAFGK